MIEITWNDLIDFNNDFFAGKFSTQRYGQAFICKFDPEESDSRIDHKWLWEVKDSAVAADYLIEELMEV